MANDWKCDICSAFLALTLKELLHHITIMHSNETNFRVKCIVSGCPYEYSKMNSLCYHLSNYHRELQLNQCETQNTDRQFDRNEDAEIINDYAINQLENEYEDFSLSDELAGGESDNVSDQVR